MKVTFIKPHLQWNPGQVADLDEGVANYLLNVGIVTTEQADNETIEKVLEKKLQEVKKVDKPEVKKAPKKAAKKSAKKAVKK